MLLKIFILSITSIVVLFIIAKLIGNRQISQVTLFDYINGITIGSIAAEMATSLEDDFRPPLVAMLIYGAAAILISFISTKSIAMRKLFTGRPLVLFEGGVLYRKNLVKAKLDLSEFLMMCRVSGYFNLSDLQTVLMEPNGHLSFIPRAEKRPLTPEDMQLHPQQELMIANVILDGALIGKNLDDLGLDRKWLEKQLFAQGFKSVSEVTLATCDSDKNLSVYRRIDTAEMKDLFE